jgi:hypothetical protein
MFVPLPYRLGSQGRVVLRAFVIMANAADNRHVSQAAIAGIGPKIDMIEVKASTEISIAPYSFRQSVKRPRGLAAKP